jgi:alpha 1,6-mannosyltransferase
MLSNPPYSLKFFGVAALITASFLLFFKYGSWDIGNLRSSAELCPPNPPQVTVTVTVPATASPSPTGIPEKLWYKLGAKGLNDDCRQWIEGCLMRNPTYQFEFMTDATSDLYVKRNYVNRPDIVETYLNIPIPILKADFLRYLILYHDGGVWSDLDVSCEEIPINDWIPAKYKESTNLVVGLEFDWAWENDNFLHSQFASWTVMAKPRSPHLLVIINDILEDFRQKCKDHSVKLPDLKLDMVGHVVDITGPKRMTRGIVKSLEVMIQETIDDRYVQSSVS